MELKRHQLEQALRILKAILAENFSHAEEGGTMKVCVHDNPATMHRECWQDGRLTHSYSMRILPGGPLPQAQQIPGRLFFFGANVGAWEEGRVWGDAEAMHHPPLHNEGAT